MAQSIEPNIADLANGWMKSYKLDYKLEQESVNTEIEKALTAYYSKAGGNGGNRPDAKLFLRDKKGNDYPILIEYKGYKNKLVKLDDKGDVENKTAKSEPN
ncbi:MAG TPA: restriction endonuclease subunit M, partial [Aquificales bacterium]|nr:restriction endonuclease subunit M [Aquificales bacterium]